MFLQRLMALYVASHYKNSPNDLQLLSDAPAHRIFCLLGPVDAKHGGLPEILCVVQVRVTQSAVRTDGCQIALEGEISKDSIQAGLERGVRASGDLIPWTVAQQVPSELNTRQPCNHSAVPRQRLWQAVRRPHRAHRHAPGLPEHGLRPPRHAAAQKLLRGQDPKVRLMPVP